VQQYIKVVKHDKCGQGINKLPNKSTQESLDSAVAMSTDDDKSTEVWFANTAAPKHQRCRRQHQRRFTPVAGLLNQCS